ncbi:MAG: PaaI family thioesterase [Candidatus Macondimonas sp.]
MELQQLIQTAREQGDLSGLMGHIPYARLIGMDMQLDEAGQPLFVLPYQSKNIGNTALPALHGGVIGGFLENSAIVHLIWKRDAVEMPKTIDFSLDYLRSGRAIDCYARCEVTRQGRRIAHVTASCWQQDPAQPVAVARVHFLLT